ncbi:MAG: caspase family protein [Flavobacteriales bacterium]|nr:caspase family protein [Flavobacteriales bacterium]
MTNYAPTYTTSRALVIGINKYEHESPLAYARNDAEGVRNVLFQRFGFKFEHIITLLDEEATYSAIRRAFLRFANSGTDYDDRLFIFFAGHGHTITGRRGEIGYLVPWDGRTDDLSTLIRWDDLTKNGDLIRAKHILYVMDACYGGLALTRSLQQGTKRFLKDMLTRHSRQVITAGKADERVSDAGGPRAGHSVFTGHFLDALEGDTVRQEGPVTANRAMAYVYHKVSGDPDSHQTPHFGFLDGDGDFLFDNEILTGLQDSAGSESDLLVSMAPYPIVGDAERAPAAIDLVKEYLSEARFRIKLDDLFAQELRAAVAQLTPVQFPTSGVEPNADRFIERVRAYSKIIAPLQRVCTLLSRWGVSEDHKELLRRIIAQLAPVDVVGGYDVWSELRWFPAMLVAFSTGIGAVAQGNYYMLQALFSARVANPRTGAPSSPLFTIMLDQWRVLLGTGIFRTIPGHEKHYVPDREFLFKLLQPSVEDLLFLGPDYEMAFDRFEALLALNYLYETVQQDDDGGFALPGRYAYKRGRSGDPYMILLEEANRQGGMWPPIVQGAMPHYQTF